MQNANCALSLAWVGKGRYKRLFAACLIVLSFAFTSASEAKSAYAEHVCDEAAKRAAASSGVPVDVLRAVTRVETGRQKNGRSQPWPWTVNMEGAGAWFDTEDEVRAFVFKHFKRGARSFDIGCFQINYKWHGAHF